MATAAEAIKLSNLAPAPISQSIRFLRSSPFQESDCDTIHALIEVDYLGQDRDPTGRPAVVKVWRVRGGYNWLSKGGDCQTSKGDTLSRHDVTDEIRSSLVACFKDKLKTSTNTQDIKLFKYVVECHGLFNNPASLRVGHPSVAIRFVQIVWRL